MRPLVVGLVSALIVAAVAIAGPASAAPVHREPRGHFLLKNAADSTLVQTATSPKQLTNYGGRVVGNAKVYVVKWGTTGTFFPQVTNGGAASFFGGVTNSPFFDWLSEYDTPSQHIGRGSYAGTITLAPAAANNSSTIDDAANIEPELQAQIAAHNLPTPDADTIFFLYFRKSQVIDAFGANSLVDFCAYHNTIARSPANVLYAVMPYEESGCGSNPGVWDNMTEVSSHELLETVTDPDVGLADSFGPPLTWYNARYGEVADICEGMPSARVVGGDDQTYVVQQAWSNSEKACLATRVRTVSVGDATMAEGNARNRSMKFAVTLSDPAPTTVTVHYELAGVNATGAKTLAPGIDFNNRGGAIGTLTFTRGSTGLTPVVKYVTVPVRGDTDATESDETFTVTISDATAPYTIVRAQGTGTILNDDGASGLFVSAGDASISAGDVHTRVVAIPVTLSATAPTQVTMHYATSAAGAGTAFRAAGGTVTFPSGTVSKVINITVYPDSAPPPGEEFTLTLSAVDGHGTSVQLWRPTGTGTILGNS